MFACRHYGSILFSSILDDIRASFSFVINTDDNIPALKAIENNFGLHLFVGNKEDSLIKVDILNWGDDFIFPCLEVDKIRLASIEEIAAMKLDVISRGGRKKDFWDLSEILDSYSLPSLLEIYKQKYPYYDIQSVISGLIDFSVAENMPDPFCFKGKHWEVIRDEMIDIHGKLRGDFQ